MCIAIMKPQGKIIPKKTLEECYRNNPDGAGFMFSSNKQLHIKKGYFKFKDFYEAYKKYEDKKCAIHFRIKTHGKIDETNCHPFNVNGSLGFIHNGIISGYGNNDKSDTIEFNEQVLQGLVNKWGNLSLFEKPVTKLIQSTIGYSKLVFLDRHNNHHIINEDMGEWHKGVWYSNSSYKKPKYDYTKWSWNKNKHNDYQPYTNLWGQKQLPAVMETTPPTGVGDICEFTDRFTDHSTKELFVAGDVCEVIDFHADTQTADVMVEHWDGTPRFAYDVPLRLLDTQDFS